MARNRPTVARSGSATVEVDSALQNHVDGLLGGLPGRTRKRFEAKAHATKTAALPDWPVKTGRSKRGFRIRTDIIGDGIETRLLNTERHTYMIRWSRFTRAEINAQKSSGQRRWMRKHHGLGAPKDDWIYKSPWQELVKKPATRGARHLAKELEPDLLALAEGRALR